MAVRLGRRRCCPWRPGDLRGTWLFPEQRIRQVLRAKPEDLRIITIDGGSMEPLLSSGDRIVIDASQRVPAPPGIFVI